MEKILFVTEDERKRIAKNYTYRPEGSNMPVDIVDMGKLAMDIQKERKDKGDSMIIEIKPIIPRKDRDVNKGITHVKDPYFNAIYGIFAGLDDFKNVTWARISLENGITLNLDEINDAKRWGVLRMHPSIQGSPFEKDPIYKVEDPSIEASKTTRKVQKIERLFDLVKKMDGYEIVDTLRYLGEVVDENLNLDIARSRLMDSILQRPEAIYERMGNKQRGLEAKILAAVEYNIIENHPEHGYRFNNINLGLSQNDVLNIVEKDDNIKSAILSLVKEKDVVSANIQDQYEKKRQDDKKGKGDIKL